MAMPGETISTGAEYNGSCPDCGKPMPIKVCHSAAGYYIGTWCEQCGPYSRESGYYPSSEQAEKDLSTYKPRDTGYHEGTLKVHKF